MDDRSAATQEREKRDQPGPEKGRKCRAGHGRRCDPGPKKMASEGVGSIGGILIGAGIGSAAGPIGSIVGGIAGALGGWWAEDAVERAAETLGKHQDHYREHWSEEEVEGLCFDDALVGYGVGHIAGHNPAFSGRTFETIEPRLRDGWRHGRYDYDTLRPYVREGYRRTAPARD